MQKAEKSPEKILYVLVLSVIAVGTKPLTKCISMAKFSRVAYNLKFPKPYTLTLKNYSQDEFEKRYMAWKDGRCLLEDAFPDISESARYFIATGLLPDDVAERINNGNV